ncbi:hypothetical protein GQ43DRAFT_431342 [Delitschia confertaspora ATCC 74209]|uniref:Bromodomain associated domain-containing protein n=1 Tax=Delitschia confertaspora ATCC 74209 TaxID=1513339 RepID=A0A9P4JM09_9PLEO|nr:hypothetical protein GQ43DRAFT_431342 [Delitschia confertaspora ATCC 74209]
MSTSELYNALLRPAVLDILRASGFHATHGAVLDTLTDITIRHIKLLAEKTAMHAYSSHNSLEPTISDVRMAMQDCGVLVPTLTGAEEAWKERLRKPLDEYPERNGLRLKEEMRRDAEDTQDVREFIDWAQGEQAAEIRRIAGLGINRHLSTDQTADLGAGAEDYLTALMKKHSKTGVEARFQGTVLGQPAEPKPVKIEGGPESLEEWQRLVREQNVAARSGLRTPPMEPKHDPKVQPKVLVDTEYEDTAMEDAVSFPE